MLSENDLLNVNEDRRYSDEVDRGEFLEIRRGNNKNKKAIATTGDGQAGDARDSVKSGGH